jgi:hypothetical protein
MSEDIREGRRGFRLRGWRMIVGIVVVLVVAFVVFRVYGRLALNREIAKLQAKGYPVTFAELENYNRLPEGVPNAAEIYIKAFESYQPATEEEKKVVPNLGSVVRTPKEFKTDEMKATVSAFLERNAGTLDLLHEAGQVEQCRYEYPLKIGQGSLFPYFEKIKNCGQLLKQDALYRISRGDNDGACQGILDAIQIGESLNRESFMISYLVRLAMVCTAVETLPSVFSEGSASPEQYTKLEFQLLRTKNNLRIGQALIGERVFWLSDGDPWGELDLDFVIAKHVGYADYNAVRLFHYFYQLEEKQTIQPAQRRVEYGRILDEVRDLSLFYYLVQDELLRFNVVFDIDFRARAELDSAMVAIAVERYRLAERRLPESLEQLVPKYLEAVPVDPFDGKPLRYKRLEKGYTIYSIGEDGQDNGGISKDRDKPEQKFDYPFTVER